MPCIIKILLLFTFMLIISFVLSFKIKGKLTLTLYYISLVLLIITLILGICITKETTETSIVINKDHQFRRHGSDYEVFIIDENKERKIDVTEYEYNKIDVGNRIKYKKTENLFGSDKYDIIK